MEGSLTANGHEYEPESLTVCFPRPVIRMLEGEGGEEGASKEDGPEPEPVAADALWPWSALGSPMSELHRVRESSQKWSGVACVATTEPVSVTVTECNDSGFGRVSSTRPEMV